MHSRRAYKERTCQSFPYNNRTTYSYRFPVQLSPNRLVLCPGEGPELLRYIRAIAFSREGRVGWATDGFRNAFDYAKPSAVHNAGD